MAQLLGFGVDSPQTAEKVLDLAADLNRQELLQLADAAWVERRPDGKVKLHQSVNLAAGGAASGALWGTLIGLLFLNPCSARWSARVPARWAAPSPTSASTMT